VGGVSRTNRGILFITIAKSPGRRTDSKKNGKNASKGVGRDVRSHYLSFGKNNDRQEGSVIGQLKKMGKDWTFHYILQWSPISPDHPHKASLLGEAF